MISCITFKNGSFKLVKIKNVDEENIFKKCGYKSSNNFNKLYTWKVDDIRSLELWSKTDNVCKVFNQHTIFSKHSINVNSNNKCIFLLKNANDYISLDGNFFTAFFSIKDVIETGSCNNDDPMHDLMVDNKAKNPKNQFETNNSDHTSGVNHSTNKNEDYDVNSELSYELYCYSDEETL
jgi:hypothetical protein